MAGEHCPKPCGDYHYHGKQTHCANCLHGLLPGFQVFVDDARDIVICTDDCNCLAEYLARSSAANFVSQEYWGGEYPVS